MLISNSKRLKFKE